MGASRVLLPVLSAAMLAAAGARATAQPAADLAPAPPGVADLGAPQPPSVQLDAPEGPVPDVALARMRGGFDLGGVSFSFGATLNTLVDGQLALQTTVTYAPGGVTTVVTPGAGVLPVMGDQALAQLSGRGIAVTPGSTPVFATADGATAFLQGLTQQGLVNATLNTAANRTVSSNADLTVTLPNGAAFQAGVLNAHAFQSLTDQIALGALAIRH